MLEWVVMMVGPGRGMEGMEGMTTFFGEKVTFVDGGEAASEGDESRTC